MFKHHVVGADAAGGANPGNNIPKSNEFLALEIRMEESKNKMR